MGDDFIEYIPGNDKGQVAQPAQVTPNDTLYIPPEMESMYAWARLFVMLHRWENDVQEIKLEYCPPNMLRIQAGQQVWCLQSQSVDADNATEAFFSLLKQQNYSLRNLLDTMRRANLPQEWEFGKCGRLTCYGVA